MLVSTSELGGLVYVLGWLCFWRVSRLRLPILYRGRVCRLFHYLVLVHLEKKGKIEEIYKTIDMKVADYKCSVKITKRNE